MRYDKWLICILTAAFLSMILFFATREYAWDETVGITAEITADGETETITCWKSEWGDYFLMLPGCVELSQIHLRTNTKNPVYLNDVLLQDGTSCENLVLGEQYNLCFGGNRDFNLTFLQSGNLPAMFIDTHSGSMERIHQEKGNAEDGVLRLYGEDGHLHYTGALASIKGRGNATWQQEKKPYSLQLHAPADLLNMGSAENWILLANAYDETNLRNKLACDLADAAGLAFTPEINWVDLFLNGEYAGLYMLSERNEVHPERVNIAREGSFLVSMELRERLEAQEYPYVSTASGAAFRVHYADMDLDVLQKKLQAVENAILAPDGVDPETGKRWTDLIDLDSWVRKYLIEEILGNYDAGAVSQYFYLDGSDPTGKIYAGPVWDYDNILGNLQWQSQNPQAILAGRPHIADEADTPWFYALSRKEVFSDRIREVYQQTFRPLLSRLLQEEIDQYTDAVREASNLNGWRWNMGAYAERTEELCIFLEERMEFLDNLWLYTVPCHTVQICNGMGAWACFAVKPGEHLTGLPEYDPDTYLGWFYFGTDTAFDITQPIYEDAAIVLKPAEEYN